LDTDVLFAQSGNYGDLSGDGESHNFNNLMQGIAINAKGLTENIRSIVKGIEAADSNKLKVYYLRIFED